MNIPEKYLNRVEQLDNGCWEWTGWITGKRGTKGPTAPYGCLVVDKVEYRAHRYFYMLATGEPLADFHVHHKCENTLCVNPDHLERLTPRDHSRLHDAFGEINKVAKAREFCKYGHPWNKNEVVRPNGERYCLQCCRDQVNRSRLKYRTPETVSNKDKTHCSNGHPLSGDNIVLTPNGTRRCKECNRLQYYRRKAQVEPSRIIRPWGTHCNNGHELIGDNVKIQKTGSRICVQCNRDRAGAYQKAQREARKSAT